MSDSWQRRDSVSGLLSRCCLTTAEDVCGGETVLDSCPQLLSLSKLQTDKEISFRQVYLLPPLAIT